MTKLWEITAVNLLKIRRIIWSYKYRTDTTR